jgi:hypothetical protein
MITMVHPIDSWIENGGWMKRKKKKKGSSYCRRVKDYIQDNSL